MTSFFGELRRRNVVRVAVAYAIVGWILVEVSSTVLPIFEAPDWIVQVFTFFVILGFPLALILSWAYEITPEGIKLERDVAAGESITHVTGRKLDFAIIGALVLALGFVVYNYVLVDGEQAAGVLPNSVAVIPFENVSPNPDDAYYATGIHDEILNQLAKLSALNVIARTSMQQYANTEKSIPEIARELNVETVMEGSVRYSGGRIRITAQLNDGVTGAHLWSETYTRDFDDIFEIESDVAMNVANALEAEFSLEEQASIEQAITSSTEAYELYLRANSFIPNPIFVSPDELTRARALLDQAIELDPNFATAFVRRSGLYRGTGSGNLRRQDLATAVELDSSLALAHALIGDEYMGAFRGSEARQSFDRGREFGPNDPDVFSRYGFFLSVVGEYEEALHFAQRAVELDPRNPFFLEHLADVHLLSGDDERAIAALQEAIAVDPAYQIAYIVLGRIEASRGNQEQVLDYLSRGEQLGPLGIGLIAHGYALAGLEDEAERVLAETESTSINVALAMRDIELSLERLESLAQAQRAGQGSGRGNWMLIRNAFNDPILDRPEFVELRNAALARLRE